MAERLPPRARHQFVPLDRPAAWRSFLDHWRPQLALLVESELWPNLILESRRHGVPLALVNARMSARSERRWRRLPAGAAELLAGFELCLAQSAADAERFAALGARRVATPGNLKACAAAACRHRRRRSPRSPPRSASGRSWLAASTHPGEDAALLAAHRALARRLPAVLTIIAPRHPERGAALAAWLAQEGIAFARRSQGEMPGPQHAVYLADTLGELGLFYRLARVAFVGKSLVPEGGQNPLEPARLGCPVLFGPHMANFADLAAGLLRAGAARQVADGAALAAAVAEIIAESCPPQRDGRARHGRGAERGRRARGDARRAGAAARAHPRAGRCGRLSSGRRTGRCARLLDPLGRLYGLAGRARRLLHHAAAAPVPAICVGNLTVGGAGKTPVALALAARLLAAGERPHLVTARLWRPRARARCASTPHATTACWSATRRCCWRRSRRPGWPATGWPAPAPRPPPAPAS